MSIRTRVESVITAWSGIPTIDDSTVKLSNLWSQGNGKGGVPFKFAVEDLISRLVHAFPELKIRLLPSDFTGNVVTVDDLVTQIASIPAIEAFANVLTAAAVSDPATSGTSKSKLDKALARHLSRPAKTTDKKNR